MGGIGETWRSRIAKIVPFRYPGWPPLRPSLNSSNYISQTVGPIELKRWEASQWHRDSELLNRSVPISKMATLAAILKFFKRHLLPNQSDWDQNLMGGITVTHRFRIVKIIQFRYSRWPPRGPCWNSSNNISQTVGWIEPKLDGKHHSDTQIQNC